MVELDADQERQLRSGLFSLERCDWRSRILKKVAIRILWENIKRMIYFSLHILLIGMGKKYLYQLVNNFIQCRPCSNNLDFIIVHWWYFTILINLIVIVRCIIIFVFCFRCSWTSLNLIKKYWYYKKIK